MTKTLLLLSFFAAATFQASAQCTPDSARLTGTTYNYPDTLPCITSGQAYSGVESFTTPSYTILGQTLSVDSMHVDTIEGMPVGITYVINPSSHELYKGQYGCILFSGTTAVTSGIFPLTIKGMVCVTVPFVGKECLDTTLNAVYHMTMEICTANGISPLSEGPAINIYPNPNHGSFTVTLSSADRMTGEMSVIDQLGRTVHTQGIDVTGTSQIAIDRADLAPGVYVLMVNSAKGRSVRQFTID
jgi:hypothetical protein